MWECDLAITETDPSAVDPDAEAVYRVDVQNLPSFYLLLPDRECVGVPDELNEFRRPLNRWLLEWDLYSDAVIDQLVEGIPELDD